MDLITHTLITRKFIGKETSTTVAGILPDMSFYFTYPFWLARQEGGIQRSIETNEWPAPPTWMITFHYMTHSIPVATTLALLAFAFTKRFPKKFLLAWLVHILIDIPTHSKKQWAPQFLWPLSDHSFDGYSWGEAFMALFKKQKQETQ